MLKSKYFFVHKGNLERNIVFVQTIVNLDMHLLFLLICNFRG